MQFSFFIALLAIAISIACLQEVSAAPTRKYGLNKRRVLKKRYGVTAGAPPAPGFPGGAGGPPVCPDPKNPTCPPVPGPVPPAPAPPPQGVAIPGFSLPMFPDLAASTAGLGTTPAVPDPLGIIGGVLTTQATSATSIVPGLMGGVQGLTALGAAPKDD